MALESVAALALAGNIAQFLGVAVKVCKLGNNIYKLGDGAETDLERRRELGQDLLEISIKLENATASSILSPDGEALCRLAASCRFEAQQLRSLLDELALASSQRRRWQSFKTAIRRVWKEKDIKELETKLDGYRAELTLRMIALMR